jgi:hypothetical protein
MRIAAAALLGAMCASCIIGPRPVVARNLTDGGYCAATTTLTSDHRALSPDAPDTPAPEATAVGYSPRSIDVARAIGAVPLLERLAHEQATHGSPEALLHFRGQLNDAIILATLDLSSTMAHLSCEEGRALQMASNLRDAEQTQTRNLTAWSLVVTSLATIASGTLALSFKDQTPSAVAGISGGAGGLVLGAGTLVVHRSAPFLHARNALAEVWNGGSDHPDFPDLVWAYLTWPQFGTLASRVLTEKLPGRPTVRDYLVLTWKESGRLGNDPASLDSECVALLFGPGGTYDADDLDDRGDMLSEVREAVGLMSYGLQHLATEAEAH